MEPAVPSEPTDLSEPSAIAELVEPVESIESIESTEPAEPKVLAERIELSESIEPTKHSDDVIAANIDFPQNYSGVLYMQVIIYEQPNSNSELTLGLHELNRLIMV